MLSATWYWVVPFPVPVAPERMVIHVAVLVADQGQPGAVTAIFPIPPALSNVFEPGDMVSGQEPNCATERESEPPALVAPKPLTSIR